MIVVQDNRLPAYDRADGNLMRQLNRRSQRVIAVSRVGSVTLRLRRGKVVYQPLIDADER